MVNITAHPGENRRLNRCRYVSSGGSGNVELVPCKFHTVLLGSFMLFCTVFITTYNVSILEKVTCFLKHIFSLYIAAGTSVQRV